MRKSRIAPGGPKSRLQEPASAAPTMNGRLLISTESEIICSRVAPETGSSELSENTSCPQQLPRPLQFMSGCASPSFRPHFVAARGASCLPVRPSSFRDGLGQLRVELARRSRGSAGRWTVKRRSGGRGAMNGREVAAAQQAGQKQRLESWII